MSKRQDQISMLERLKMYVAEGHFFTSYRPQYVIDLINDIIEQLAKTETVVLKRAIPLITNNKEILKIEFARHIAEHIIENGYAEPKPVGITNEQTERYELEISFIKR